MFIRNSRQEEFCKKVVLRNFAKFKACNFIKKKLWHRCFSVNFAKILRTPFLQNTSGGSFLIMARIKLSKYDGVIHK